MAKSLKISLAQTAIGIWTNLRGLAKGPPLFLQRFPPPVLIDEVQYAPELFPAIKLLVDRDPEPGGVWLTGSQSFPLMKSVSESLAGRVAILNLLQEEGQTICRDALSQRLTPAPRIYYPYPHERTPSGQSERGRARDA